MTQATLCLLVAGKWNGIGGKLDPEKGDAAIYVGHWKGLVLPGAYRNDKRTKLKYWISPTKFIKDYK